ncbi:MAG: uncharacterized protein KVP18_001073 [Porospora cf. gigantea A]|nr:MAG: hypothetical protein KVP18_001073 [Porospora cf. gigantea A]
MELHDVLTVETWEVIRREPALSRLRTWLETSIAAEIASPEQSEAGGSRAVDRVTSKGTPPGPPRNTKGTPPGPPPKSKRGPPSNTKGTPPGPPPKSKRGPPGPYWAIKGSPNYCAAKGTPPQKLPPRKSSKSAVIEPSWSRQNSSDYCASKGVPPRTLPRTKNGKTPVPTKSLPKAAPGKLRKMTFGPGLPAGLVPRRLQWVPIPEKKLSGTIWEALLNSPIKIPRPARPPAKMTPAPSSPRTDPPKRLNNDVEWVETAVDEVISYGSVNLYFCERAADLKAKVVPKARIVVKHRSVLDKKRRDTIEITLRGMGLLDDLSPVFDTVGDLRQGVLTGDQLDRIITLLPTAEEIPLLQEIPDDEVEAFAKCDKFLLRTLSVSCFKERAEALVVRMIFTDELKVLQGKADVLSHCVERVLASVRGGALRLLLKMILLIGNHLNDGTSKGGCRAIALNSLEALKSLKGAGATAIPNCTLVKYLVVRLFDLNHACRDTRRLLWKDLEDSIGRAASATAQGADEIQAAVKVLRSKVVRTRAVVSGAKADHFEDQFS